MTRFFYDLHSSTLHLVLYWWGKKPFFSLFLVRSTMQEINTPGGQQRTPLVTPRIDLDKSQNKRKCLFLCLEVSGGSSDPRSSSSTAFTNKARPQNPTKPVSLPTVRQQPEKNLLKPKESGNSLASSV